MTLGSSIETVAILYDIENAPFEMLDYTLGKAQKYLPCRMIVVSDWDKRPNQKRWNRLIRREGFTFRQIDRKIDGKNSLDYALFDTALLMKKEGVQKFFIITTDSDFAKIAHALKEDAEPAHIIGVGTEQASQLLRDAYDEFICYPPLHKKADKVEKAPGEKHNKKKEKEKKEKKGQKVLVKHGQKPEDGLIAKVPERPIEAQNAKGNLQVQIPKTLHQHLLERMERENVGLSELVTYVLMRGLTK